MKHWIMFGDTRVKCGSFEQIEATNRLFNLTIPDSELDYEEIGYYDEQEFADYLPIKKPNETV